jgi:hypothetical protein
MALTVIRDCVRHLFSPDDDTGPRYADDVMLCL